MTRAWAQLLAWLDRREPATAFALMRIGIGLTVLLALVGIVRLGLVDLLFVDAQHGGVRPLTATWQVNLVGGASPGVVRGLLGALAVAAAMLTIGVGGRLPAVVTLFAWDGLTDLDPNAGGSYDELIDNALWLLFLAPATATLSVDCRLRTGRWHDAAPVAAWVRGLAVYQLVLMYFTAGIQKLSVHWVPGGDHSALFYILQWPAWRRLDPGWLASVYPLTQVASALTWWFEVLAPLWLLALWWHATRERPGRLRRLSNRAGLRWWFFACGVALHLGTWVFLEVGPFSPAALSFYFCLLGPGDLERLGFGRPSHR